MNKERKEEEKAENSRDIQQIPPCAQRDVHPVTDIASFAGKRDDTCFITVFFLRQHPISHSRTEIDGRTTEHAPSPPAASPVISVIVKPSGGVFLDIAANLALHLGLHVA